MSESKLALGVDFGGTKTGLAVGDAQGLVVEKLRLDHQPDDDASRIVERAFDRAAVLVRKYSVDRVGIATMGITRGNEVLLAPNVAGWSGLALPAAASRCFPGIEVKIANDVKAAALAETRWGQLTVVDSGIFLNWGTGIGFGLVLNHQVWMGANGAAGEVAYSWAADELGYADGHAPFEEVVGGGALVETVQRDFGLRDMAEFFDAYDAGNQAYQQWWDQIVDRVSMTVAPILLAVDVERVVVGGGLARRFERVGPALESRWKRQLPFAPPVIASQFGDEAGIRGGLAVAWSEKRAGFLVGV